MRIGLDQYTLYHLSDRSGIELLELVRAHGLDGMQFGDVHQLSRTLDRGEIREAHEFARDHNLYLEGGIPCLNPHKPGQSLLRDGDGDLKVGLRRQLEAIAVAVAGTRAVRCFVGGPGDRHRGAAPWSQQVADTISVARDLAPLLRNLDLKLAFETHADATTHDLIRVVTELGQDVAGICLDTGNLVITLEDPLPAVRRAAPYTIATHVKDGVVTFGENGLVFHARPCGQGVIPLAEIVRELYHHNPDLTLSIEDHDRLFQIPIFHDDYLATFPNLDPVELAHVVRVACSCEREIAAGKLASPAAIEATPWAERALQALDESAAYLQDLLVSLTLDPVGGKPVHQ